MNQIKILLVDDNQQCVKTLKEYFSGNPGFPVIGWADSGESAIRKVQELQPNLVFMDVSMPGMNGLEATMKIKKLANPPRVIMLTVLDDAEYRRASVEAGADGFICKSDLAKETPMLLEKLFDRKNLV
ncbi:MAG: response regulator transcription factor [Bacteroidota bacterium]|nr:response regulator transcription factor [Bacteroidota bacterium]